MVSLDRAAQCVGRRIRHVENETVKGVVARVDEHDVWVTLAGDGTIPCIPENLEWVPSLPEGLREAIVDHEEYETAQVGYAPFLWAADNLSPLPDVSILYSSATANDDDMHHSLYGIAHGMRQVHLLRITADPNGAREIEELLGWAQP